MLCTNSEPLLSSPPRLDLPTYETYEKMSDKLTQAVEETCGFAVEWEEKEEQVLKKEEECTNLKQTQQILYFLIYTHMY